MSLSPHEKIEFERLTADLRFGESDLKKMTKREQATTMSYMALPSRNTILMALVFINVFLFVNAVLNHNVILTNVTGAIGGMLTAVVMINSALAVAKPETGRK